MNHQISPETISDYLITNGLLPHGAIPTVTPLGGGISHIVLRVSTPERAMIVKQPLGKLRVEEDWFADVNRIFHEEACIRVLREVLGPDSVPDILHSDPERHLLVMSCAPDGSVDWKALLMAGDVNIALVGKAGGMLGKMHSGTARDRTVKRLFLDNNVFIQTRVDPYYRVIAERHSDLQSLILSEVDRMLAHRICLTHGDNSPKNVLVKGSSIFMIDFEAAHWGDPSMDVAFFLNHLFLKAIHNPQWHDRYLQAVRAYWEGYLSEPPVDEPRDLESHTIRQLGCLMLARVDGKSPAEYLTEEGRNLARGLGRSLILNPPPTLEAVVDRANRHLREKQ